MYGPLANILLSCYGVGMEQTFLGKVLEVHNLHSLDGLTMVEVVVEVGQSPDHSFFMPKETCPWEVGDRVKIDLSKLIPTPPKVEEVQDAD